MLLLSEGGVFLVLLFLRLLGLFVVDGIRARYGTRQLARSKSDDEGVFDPDFLDPTASFYSLTFLLPAIVFRNRCECLIVDGRMSWTEGTWGLC